MHFGATGSPRGCNKVEFPATAGPELGGHKYRVNNAGTFRGSLVRGYPAPD